MTPAGPTDDDSRGLAYAYRVVADAALAIGVAALVVAIALHVRGAGGVALALYGTTVIAGLVAIAAAAQRTRYRGR